MEYPLQLDLKVLNSEHPEYTELKMVWKKIDLLSSGGYKLERSIAEFLPQRFEEPPEIYKQRIQKFTYRNILGDTLKHQVARLANGFVSVSGFPPDGEEAEFWERFRKNTNSRGRSEKDLISDLASTLLKFKYAYLQVDRERAEVPPRNINEEQELLGDPYILLHSPQAVIDWGETNNKLEWVKLRSIAVNTTDPFAEEPSYIATWTYIDSTNIAKYTAEVELDKGGSIKGLAINKSGESINSVALDSSVSHGLDSPPIFKIQLKDEMWACDQASGKAYEHLRLDCHKFDLLTFAYFQRYYNRQKLPDSDVPGRRSALTETYVDSDSSPMVGLEYVPELEGFQFAEPSGAIVEHINNTLQRVEQEVEQLLDLTGASTETDRVQQQSGYAREFDFIAQRESLRAYGAVIINDGLQPAYKLVNQYRGSLSPVDVSGLDSFEIDDLQKLFTNLVSIVSIDFVSLQDKLPPMLFSLLYERLCMLLSSNISPEQAEQLKQEVQAKQFVTALVVDEPPRVAPSEED